MKKKILLIEDSPYLSRALNDFFTDKGFDMLLAADGNEGMRIVYEHKPDLIILDLMIPGISGEEVCKRVRKDETVSATPIIMITAKGSDVDKIVGRVIGANVYLTKPFGLDVLLREVSRIMAPETSTGISSQGKD
jgi:two-component system alkaline phosphatase synthesis response regulator PhoP